MTIFSSPFAASCVHHLLGAKSNKEHQNNERTPRNRVHPKFIFSLPSGRRLTSCSSSEFMCILTLYKNLRLKFLVSFLLPPAPRDGLCVCVCVFCFFCGENCMSHTNSWAEETTMNSWPLAVSERTSVQQTHPAL